MKLGSICPSPCFAHAAAFEVPPPGCTAEKLRFGADRGRVFHAVLLTNHDLQQDRPNPKVAIVGLSPAGNQIKEFVRSYQATGIYAEASMAGAFAGLSRDIVGMMNGLGLTDRLGLRFPNPDNFSNHPDIYVTSLVGCATLTETGSSDDFDLTDFPAAQRCVTDRFLPEMLSPDFSRLSHIIILGTKGWGAMTKMKTAAGSSVLSVLRRSGKTVLNLPHPSPQNLEYVKLASLPDGEVPSRTDYAKSMWAIYVQKPPRKGRGKETEGAYKSKRLAYWDGVARLREEIERSFPT